MNGADSISLVCSKHQEGILGQVRHYGKCGDGLKLSTQKTPTEVASLSFFKGDNVEAMHQVIEPNDTVQQAICSKSKSHSSSYLKHKKKYGDI